MEGRPSKRQRASPTSSSTSDSDDSPALNPMEIFRRHFESRFQAIDGPPIAALDPTSSSNTIDEGSDVEDGEEWSGISASEESESEENTSVEVVYHTSSAYSEARRMSKRKLSEFMSSKPPSPVSLPPRIAKSPSAGVDDDAENLQNDLALQRLLRESHLLDPSSETLEVRGTQRLKALHLRMEALGGKRITQQKMALNIKRGIEGKRAEREKKRRREARETGVVLEKEKKEVKVRRKGAVAGKGLGMLDAPAVGRFKGGALVLSKKDVRDITGGGERKGGKRGRGQGRGRGKNG